MGPNNWASNLKHHGSSGGAHLRHPSSSVLRGRNAFCSPVLQILSPQSLSFASSFLGIELDCRIKGTDVGIFPEMVRGGAG